MTCKYKYNDKWFTENELIYLIGEKKNLLDISNKQALERLSSLQEIFKQVPQLQEIGTIFDYDSYLDTIFPDSKVKDIVYHGSTDNPTNKKSRKLGIFFTDDKNAANIYAVKYKDDEFEDSIIQGIVKKFGLNPTIEQIKSEIAFFEKMGATKEQIERDAKEYQEYIQNNKGITEQAILNIENPKNLTVKDWFDNYDDSSSLKENADGLLLKGGKQSNNRIYDAGENQIVVFQPEQIHILGSKQDIEGFKKFIEQPINKEIKLNEVNLSQEQQNFAKKNSIEQNFFDGKAYHKGKDGNGKDIWGNYKIKNGIKSSIEGALKGFRTQTTRSVSQIEQLKSIAKNQGITNGVAGTIVWMEDKGEKSPTKGQGGWFKITSEPYTPNKIDFNNFENWESNVWEDRSSEFKIGTKDEWKSIRFEAVNQPTEIKPKIDSSKKINIYAGTNENKELSNLANRPFTLQGSEYDNVEQYFQLQKFQTAGVLEFDYDAKNAQQIADKIHEIADKIANTKSGFEAKKLGGTRIAGTTLNEEFWNKINSSEMKTAIKASFEQNPNALKALLATGNAELTHTQDKSKWGKEFPKLLMEVRQELTQEQPIVEETKEGEMTLKDGKNYNRSEIGTKMLEEMGYSPMEIGKLLKEICG